VSLLDAVRAAWRRVTFYYGWNPWLVEILSGFATLLVAVVVVTVPLVAARCLRFVGFRTWLAVVAVVAATLRVLYERYVDPNGWSWRDVGQAACGIAAGVGLIIVGRVLAHV